MANICLLGYRWRSFRSARRPLGAGKLIATELLLWKRTIGIENAGKMTRASRNVQLGERDLLVLQVLQVLRPGPLARRNMLQLVS